MLNVSIKKQLNHFSLDATFSIGNGITSILGPSGCGKSMTLSCIAGLSTPDAGIITLHDQVLFDSSIKENRKARHRNVGYVFQQYALFPHLNVRENIAFGLKGKYKKEARYKKAYDMLKRVQLEEYANHYPSQLSGGQKQRVALARTLVTEPELLLLDEPFSALDQHIKHQLEQELLSIIKENYSGGVILVTHNMEEAYRLSERIILMDSGRVIQEGVKDEVFKRPKTRASAQIIGCKNVLPIDSMKKDNESIVCQVGPYSFTSSHNEEVTNARYVGIHAEDVRFSNKESIHSCTYTLLERLTGMHTTYLTLKVGSLTIQVSLPNDEVERSLSCRFLTLPNERIFYLLEKE